jgi:hypothetical protein
MREVMCKIKGARVANLYVLLNKKTREAHPYKIEIRNKGGTPSIRKYSLPV